MISPGSGQHADLRQARPGCRHAGQHRGPDQEPGPLGRFGDPKEIAATVLRTSHRPRSRRSSSAPRS
ncbi:hypothetical protein ACU4GD_22950 [Cupriavidus basilensis]